MNIVGREFTIFRSRFLCILIMININNIKITLEFIKEEFVR